MSCASYMNNKTQELTESTQVYLPMLKPGTFYGMYDFGSDKKFNFAFTSIEKLKEFVKVGKRAGIFKGVSSEMVVFPCSIGQYYIMKDKDPILPDLSVDTDPNYEAIKNLFIGDSSRENIKATMTEDATTEYWHIKKSKRNLVQ